MNLTSSLRRLLKRIVLAGADPEVSIVATPYKVGSTALFETLTRPLLFTGGHIGALQTPLPRCAHFTVKLHTDGRDLTAFARGHGLNFRRIFTALRHPGEIFVSGYFQNITTTSSPHFFGTKEEVLAAPVPDLVEHFFGFDWCGFPQFSIRHNAESIAAYAGINYLEDFGPAPWPYRYFQGSHGGERVLLGVAQMAVFRDLELFAGFLRRARFRRVRWRGLLSGAEVNAGAAKWYGVKYRETSLALRGDRRFGKLVQRAAAALPAALRCQLLSPQERAGQPDSSTLCTP